MNRLRRAALVAAIAVPILWSTAPPETDEQEQAQATEASAAAADARHRARVELATQFAEASHAR